MRPVSASGDTNSDIARIKSTVQADKAGSGAFSHDEAAAAGKTGNAGKPAVAARTAEGGKSAAQGSVPMPGGGSAAGGKQAAAGKAAGAELASAAAGEAGNTLSAPVGKSGELGFSRGAVSAAIGPVGDRLADFVASLQLRPDTFALAAAQALMAEGLSLNRALILQLRAFMRRFPGQEQLAAGVAARALAAGLDLDHPLVEGLAGFFSADGEDTDRQAPADSGQQHAADGSQEHAAEGGQHPGGSRRKNSGISAQADELPDLAVKPGAGLPDSGPTRPSAVSSLADALQKQAAGLFSDSGMRELHRPGPDGRAWLHIPLDFQKDTIEFHVMLRILYNYHSKSSEKMVLALEQNETLWMFDLDVSRSTCRLLGGHLEPEVPVKLLRTALQRYEVALLLPQAAEASQSPTLMRVDQHV